LAYDGSGRLLTVTGPVAGATTTYTYDAYGRLRTVTDSDGYTVTTDYDVFDRPIRQTYPDGTYEETVYERLDPVRTRDRLGRWTYRTYDADRRLTATRDPAGRTVRQEWCSCGGLDALVDAKGQRTSWLRDIQSRVTSEVRADGTTTTTYTYDLTSRLKTVTDPKLQLTTYTYAADGAILGQAFTNTQIATPSVSYTFDAAYGRLATMVDGLGVTAYTYHPVGSNGAGRLATVDGHLPDDTIALNYDALGRTAQRTINGMSNSVIWARDALGRVTSQANVLGTFAYSYDGLTSRLATVTYPNGQTTLYTFQPAAQGRRLQTIHHKNPNGATLSKFDYTYDGVGNILTWQQVASNDPPVVWEYGYDPADQLIRAIKTASGSSTILQRYGWGYDAAGNRLYEQVDDTVTGWTYNSLNRPVSQYDGGSLRFAGTVNEPATVTVSGQSTTLSSSGTFAHAVPVISGTNTIAVRATDAAGNTAEASYQVTVGATSSTLTFDANGNLEADGVRVLAWDAKDRLLRITDSQGVYSIEYDGKNRRRRLVRTVNGSIEFDRQLVACGGAICEERSSDGSAVDRRRLGLGELAGAVPTFIVRDHLDSARQVTNLGATVVGTYEFAPFGETAFVGSAAVRSGYTGFDESIPAMPMARYRSYQPASGRWASEDPARFVDGPNLMRYAHNNPITNVDPTGMFAIDASCKGDCFGTKNLEPIIRNDTEAWCRNLTRITDVKLRRCVQESCKSGVIECDGEWCMPPMGGYTVKWPFITTRTAVLCPDSWGNKDRQYVSDTVIHEWAHGCGWDEEDPDVGVPK
jgi:RHS repeat-associated protein